MPCVASPTQHYEKAKQTCQQKKATAQSVISRVCSRTRALCFSTPRFEYLHLCVPLCLPLCVRVFAHAFLTTPLCLDSWTSFCPTWTTRSRTLLPSWKSPVLGVRRGSENVSALLWLQSAPLQVAMWELAVRHCNGQALRSQLQACFTTISFASLTPSATCTPATHLHFDTPASSSSCRVVSSGDGGVAVSCCKGARVHGAKQVDSGNSTACACRSCRQTRGGGGHVVLLLLSAGVVWQHDWLR